LVTFVLDEPLASAVAEPSLVPDFFFAESLTELFPDVVDAPAPFPVLFFVEPVFSFSRVSRRDADGFLPEALPESVSRANEVFLPTRYL